MNRDTPTTLFNCEFFQMCLLGFQCCSKPQSYTRKTMKSVREVTSACTVYGCESHYQSPIQTSLELCDSSLWLALPPKGSHSQRETSPRPVPRTSAELKVTRAALCCPAPALPSGCHLRVSTMPLLGTREPFPPRA